MFTAELSNDFTGLRFSITVLQYVTSAGSYLKTRIPNSSRNVSFHKRIHINARLRLLNILSAYQLVKAESGSPDQVWLGSSKSVVFPNSFNIYS